MMENIKKRGRPRKPEHKRRRNRQEVYFRDALYERLLQVSEEQGGSSMSDVINQFVAKGIKYEEALRGKNSGGTITA